MKKRPGLAHLKKVLVEIPATTFKMEKVGHRRHYGLENCLVDNCGTVYFWFGGGAQISQLSESFAMHQV